MDQAAEATARDVCVHGLVQGVGFRFACAREADRLGVTGWVRNEHDGTVAGHFEGPAEAVDALVEWCRRGPAHAAVEDVEVRTVAPSSARSFQAQ